MLGFIPPPTQLLALDGAGLAGLAGFEPANTGVKDQCLYPLGDSPIYRRYWRVQSVSTLSRYVYTVTYSASVSSAVFGASFTVVESNPLTGSAILAIRFQCLTFVTPFVM